MKIVTKIGSTKNDYSNVSFLYDKLITKTKRKEITMSENKKTLGQFLKDEREKRGYTQEQMADALQMSRPDYTIVERDARPVGFDLQNRIATLFKRSPAYIRRLIKNTKELQ